MTTLIQGDCLDILPTLGEFDMVFADPPDNIGLGYNAYDDHLQDTQYIAFLAAWLVLCTERAPIVWFSFNARWTAEFGGIVSSLCGPRSSDFTYRACVQVFTFGQHNHHWLGNNHRPLWCIYRKDAVFYPDAIRVPSWRQLHGDKRADPRGRVPGDVFAMEGSADSHAADSPSAGDVFDFPRVTGNSKQRQSWHPTQLHEDLIERVVKFSTVAGQRVLDPFAGTGTTARVCQRWGRFCTTIELDADYCQRIAEQQGLSPTTDNIWATAV